MAPFDAGCTAWPLLEWRTMTPGPGARTTATVHAAAAAPGPRPHSTARIGRWFHTGAAATAIALSVAAFAPSIVDQAGRRGPLTALVTGHAIFMTAWLALFFAQACLVARGRTAVHRRLGLVAIPVAAGVAITGFAATVAMARRGYDLSGDLSRPPASAVDQLVFQFGAIPIFTALVAAALLVRRRPQAHKRLMTIATVQCLMAAPLAHLVGHFGLPAIMLPAWGVVCVLTLMAYDRVTRGRLHPVSLYGGVGLVIVNNLQFAVIGPSRTWQQLIAWLAT